MAKFYPNWVKEDDSRLENPAMQLFGNRFVSDQSYAELLIELLLVINSPKKIGENKEWEIAEAFPSIEILHKWTEQELFYSPQMRLNFKLFSFLSNSPLASRPQVQREHHQELRNKLLEKIACKEENRESALVTLEALFQGFHRVGAGRNWCAQSFIPICPALLAGESIWNEKKSLQENASSWAKGLDSVIANVSKHFSFNKHRFLSRGGEALFLQICNALKQNSDDINAWLKQNEIDLSQEESDPVLLHQALLTGFDAFINVCPSTLSEIAELIDKKLDNGETHQKTDLLVTEERRYVSTGWVNTDSWQEGYLFAVELSRLLKSSCTLTEKVELMECLCGVHAMRVLSLQSSRVLDETYVLPWPGYNMVLSQANESRSGVKRLAHESLKRIELNIYKAVRTVDLTEKVKQTDELNSEIEKLRLKADQDYGSKLFLKYSKSLGIVVPKQGNGARFILTEQLLRLLVMTCLEPDKKITFETFRGRVKKHFGFIFGVDDIQYASQWINDGIGVNIEVENDEWVQDMLLASGFLIHLSDACALVENPNN